MSGILDKDLGVMNPEEKQAHVNMINYHNSLLSEIDRLDRFIMNDTNFHYLYHSNQILLKHKVVIMEISRSKLLMLIKNFRQSSWLLLICVVYWKWRYITNDCNGMIEWGIGSENSYDLRLKKDYRKNGSLLLYKYGKMTYNIVSDRTHRLSSSFWKTLDCVFLF